MRQCIDVGLVVAADPVLEALRDVVARRPAAPEKDQGVRAAPLPGRRVPPLTRRGGARARPADLALATTALVCVPVGQDAASAA
jgi:hypothetical protein